MTKFLRKLYESIDWIVVIHIIGVAILIGVCAAMVKSFLPNGFTFTF